MTTAAALARRLERLEAASSEAQRRRWRAAVDRMRASMAPEHGRLVANWLRTNVDGKRRGACDGAPDHVCPGCIDRLEPPALARAVWLMLLGHMTGNDAPIGMPPEAAEVYLSDPKAYPANACEGCGYLLPAQGRITPDGRYDLDGWYTGACPMCGQHTDLKEDASA